MNPKHPSILFLLLAILSLQGFAQEDKEEVREVRIIHTDQLNFVESAGGGLQRLLGNVQILHDSTYFFCDSAHYYPEKKLFRAYSDVKIEMPDSVTMWCDRMDYDSQTKVMRAFDNITLTDPDAKLETNRLTYYREKEYGYYTENGTLSQDSNVLVSRTGYYYPNKDMAYFRHDVKLTNPDYTLTTDTLGYNTDTKVAYFMTYTEIKSDDNEVITTNGLYDTENDKIDLFDQSSVQDSSYSLRGDTLFYQDGNNIGEARGNVILDAKEDSMVITGGYAWFNRDENRSYVTQNPIAIQTFDADTLYLLADTLFSYEDTLLDKKYFRAYHNVVMYMNDMQGRADSLVYHYSDSMIEFFFDPILWSDSSQLTGDSITLFLKNNAIDSMLVKSKGFLVSQEDTVGFNQVKGQEIRAKFKDNEIRRMHVIGNSENLYFTKDEAGSYEGMNKALSQEMTVYIKDNTTQKVVFKARPEGDFFPFHEVIFQENRLEGMTWRYTEKPIHPKKLSPEEQAEMRKRKAPVPASETEENEQETTDKPSSEQSKPAGKQVPVGKQSPSPQQEPSNPAEKSNKVPIGKGKK